jgi:DNA-binding transcriptional MerR regulator
MFTVGELARLTGITVRALHHYDEIGLVIPSERTAAGYRMYGDADVLRLQQVLLFRELGLPLGEIAHAIDSADRATLLREHREALVAKRARIDAMLAALDAYKGADMQPDDVTSMFDGFDPAAYEEEAREKWGETDSYKEAARRTATYGRPEWDALRAEADSIYRRLAALMGTPVGDPAVQALVEEHRAHLERWFYPCGKAMHHGLGQMYVADPRFAANLDKVAPGFARYLAEAIAAS